MRQASLCIYGLFLAFSNLPRTTVGWDENTAPHGNAGPGPCTATLIPGGPCGQGQDTCPYRVHLPPVVVLLPKQLGNLEEMVREIQRLKNTVDQLRRSCGASAARPKETDRARPNERENKGGKEKQREGWVTERASERESETGGVSGGERGTDGSKQKERTIVAKEDKGRERVLEEGEIKELGKRQEKEKVKKERDKEGSIKEEGYKVVEKHRQTERTNDMNILGERNSPAGSKEDKVREKCVDKEAVLEKGKVATRPTEEGRELWEENEKETKMARGNKGGEQSGTIGNACHLWRDEKEERTEEKPSGGLVVWESDGAGAAQDHTDTPNQDHAEERAGETGKKRNDDKPKQNEISGRTEGENATSRAEAEGGKQRKVIAERDNPGLSLQSDFGGGTTASKQNQAGRVSPALPSTVLPLDEGFEGPLDAPSAGTSAPRYRFDLNTEDTEQGHGTTVQRGTTSRESNAFFSSSGSVSGTVEWPPGLERFTSSANHAKVRPVTTTATPETMTRPGLMTEDLGLSHRSGSTSTSLTDKTNVNWSPTNPKGQHGKRVQKPNEQMIILDSKAVFRATDWSLATTLTASSAARLREANANPGPRTRTTAATLKSHVSFYNSISSTTAALTHTYTTQTLPTILSSKPTSPSSSGHPMKTSSTAQPGANVKTYQKPQPKAEAKPGLKRKSLSVNRNDQLPLPGEGIKGLKKQTNKPILRDLQSKYNKLSYSGKNETKHVLRKTSKASDPHLKSPYKNQKQKSDLDLVTNQKTNTKPGKSPESSHDSLTEQKHELPKSPTLNPKPASNLRSEFLTGHLPDPAVISDPMTFPIKTSLTVDQKHGRVPLGHNSNPDVPHEPELVFDPDKMAEPKPKSTPDRKPKAKLNKGPKQRPNQRKPSVLKPRPVVIQKPRPNNGTADPVHKTQDKMHNTSENMIDMHLSQGNSEPSTGRPDTAPTLPLGGTAVTFSKTGSHRPTPTPRHDIPSTGSAAPNPTTSPDSHTFTAPPTTTTLAHSPAPDHTNPEPPAKFTTPSARELRVKIDQVAKVMESPPKVSLKGHQRGGSEANSTEQRRPMMTSSIETKAPRDCSDYLHRGRKTSGLQRVTPNPRNTSFHVFCNMDLHGGGWTLIQRRQDGSVNFNRTWAEYSAGFGQINGGEFWLGNEKIHLLTRARDMVLRVELEDFNGVRGHAEYGRFRVASERQRYRLTVGSYSGSAGDALQFSRTYDHNNRAFTTPDRDHDHYPSGNCGAYYSSGWWFNACMAANLNGRYYFGRYKGIRDGIFWGTWRNISAEYYPTNERQSFKRVTMMIRPKGIAT